ncbi:MAG: TonB-dependent receptor [Pseudomonadota bacterium]
MKFNKIKNRLLIATAIGFAVMMPSAAMAQEEDTETTSETETSEDGEFLGELTLGQSKREVQTGTATPITTIKQEEIDDRQANTIAELIDSVPGVTLVNGQTPQGSGINIRGFGANSIYGTDQKVAVLVDGATTGAEEIYRVSNQLFTDPYLYKSVDVIRGTVGSFEYGSGIVGGVVLLETKDASDFTGGEPGFGGSLTLGGQTNGDGINGSGILAWQPSEKAEFLFNYTYRDQDNQEDGSGNEIGNSAFELPSFLVKGRYAFDDTHSIMASYTQSDSADRDVPYDTFVTGTDFFGNVDRDVTTQTGSLFYYFQPAGNDLIDLEAALTYSNQEIDQTYIPFTNGFGAEVGFGVVDADLQYERTKLTVKNTSFVQTGSIEHEIRTGVEFIQNDRLEASAAPGGTDNRQAIFIIDNIDFGNGLTFTPALRYENQTLETDFFDLDAGERVEGEFDDSALMGGASLRYQFENGFAVFGSYAYTESLPILDDTPTTATSNRSNIFTAEEASTYEAGFSYDTIGVFSDSDTLSFKLNYYDTTLEDITFIGGLDEISLQGVELEGSFAMESGFYVDLNGNFSDGDEINTAGVSVTYRSLTADSVRVTAGKRFGRFLDVSLEALSVADADVSFRSGNPEQGDSYNIFNARATISPQSGILKGTSFRLGVENLSDEDYTPNLSTRKATGQNFKLTVSRQF